MSILQSTQLLDQLTTSIDASGWRYLLVQNRKPFRFRLFKDDESGFLDVRIYIWNCTHGGGAARATNEYRVQLTGVVPNIAQNETTILLGWHDGYQVFVAFDMNRHNGQNSQSPSIQIKEETLQAAHRRAFAIYFRQNGEIAVAFRPEFLVEYILASTELHKTGIATADLSILNDLDSVTDEQVVSLQSQERQMVVSQIVRKYRAADFRKRVLGAYGHRCAVCGVQLQLIDAAHIIPVAVSTSTDETINGVALCKLHHAAYDRNLISFDEQYRIQVSHSEVVRLSNLNLVGGIQDFQRGLKSVLILPFDRRDYPNPVYIRESRSVRRWT